MTRKNYIALAKIIRWNMAAAADVDRLSHNGADCNRALLRQVAYDICRYAAAESPRFQQAKFLADCGLHNPTSATAVDFSRTVG